MSASDSEVARWLQMQVSGVRDPQLTCDSREVRSGHVFCAFPGARTDGRRFLTEVPLASAVLYEPEGFPGALVQGSWPSLGVSGLKDRLGGIAAAFYGNPCDKLKIVAVTGTNGKTTCAHWIASGLANLGFRCGVVGTLGYGEFPQQRLAQGETDSSWLAPLTLTTPDALSLQRIFRDFAANGLQFAVIEASSIGIDQGRLTGVKVHTAVFTGLSRDHLDYHKDMSSYFVAKLRLFQRSELCHVVVNSDDPVAVDVVSVVSAGIPISPLKLLFGESKDMGRPDRGTRPFPVCGGTTQIDGVFSSGRMVVPPEAGCRELQFIYEKTQPAGGVTGKLLCGSGVASVTLPVRGEHNLRNALSAAAVWLGFGISLCSVVELLSRLPSVCGRMEELQCANSPLVFVDYAHTPDALERILCALRPIASQRGGKLWCVFGAGGGRDEGKRPLMGAAAERWSDRVVITTDNPRDEDPSQIARDICQGLSKEPWHLELDRQQAITQTVLSAASEDVLVLAGRGHERFQAVRGGKLPLLDADVARQAMAQRAVQPPRNVSRETFRESDRPDP